MMNLRTVLAITAFVFLAACESDEERAEGHYESAVELAEAGDVDRAIVELRNVLQLNDGHREGRLLFARLMMEQGDTRQALASYLRVVEQYPDELEGRLVLAESAALSQNWEAAERHGRAAFELAPDNPDAQAIDLVLDYRQALLDRDDAARSEVIGRAVILVDALPENVVLRSILVDGRNWQGDRAGALEQVDAAIAAAPDHRPLYFSKLSILGGMGDEPAIEAHMRQMVERFPDDDEISAAFIRFLVNTGDLDKAEAFFREIADPNAPEVAPYIALVRFIAQTRGPEAAIAELDATAETSAHPFELRALRAGMRFDIGEREQALATMEEIVAEGPPVAVAGDIKMALAQMLLNTGNEVGARRRVEEVLEAEPLNVAALKMQSTWFIEADEVDEAIRGLRLALDQDGDDVGAMTLLAQAYSRAGSHELARDTLALAVTTSLNAPEPTLRYAAVLLDEGRLRAAESLLVTALRNAPDHVGLLAALGRTYLLEQDFSRGRGVLDRLDRLGTPEAGVAADELRVALLAAQERTDELLEVLDTLASGSDAEAQARAVLIRSRLANGDVDGALAVAEEAARADPDDIGNRLTLAATRAATGNLEGAIADYRAIIDSGAADARVHRVLTMALFRAGAPEDARAALDAGLAAWPQDPDLQWMRASLLEQDGDVDGAIEVYQSLYEADSNSLIVANNLASLLATWRSADPAAVERAHNIARRLRGTDIPAFQDTYGWILHLRGESEQALDYLQPAAAAMTGDPVVQYHYGMALSAAGQTEAAADQLRRALAMVADDDSRPQFEVARSELTRLENESASETIGEN
ncbi:MAG: tetratricopeptide repeat protein [Paracoccaceae bacterium]|nr:tetratricopeptide repeat protein [Paracoccaceae bacterium]